MFEKWENPCPSWVWLKDLCPSWKSQQHQCLAAARGMGHKIQQPLKEDKKMQIGSAKGNGSIHTLVVNLNDDALQNEVII